MNTKIQIISPRPLRKNVFVFNENKTFKMNNSKFLSNCGIGSSPIKLQSCNQSSPKFFDNRPQVLLDLCSMNIENSTGNCSPIKISHIEEDFNDFKHNLAMLFEENDAKSEILSILSSDHNDSFSSRNSIRSSMPPLRPVNPILKTLNLEDSATGALSEFFSEFSISENKSVHKLDVYTK
jgi:hypothetical protein